MLDLTKSPVSSPVMNNGPQLPDTDKAPLPPNVDQNPFQPLPLYAQSTGVTPQGGYPQINVRSPSQT
jgi:hypothetical protein